MAMKSVKPPKKPALKVSTPAKSKATTDHPVKPPLTLEEIVVGCQAAGLRVKFDVVPLASDTPGVEGLLTEAQPKKPILQQAFDLVCGDRAKEYGPALDNFVQIAMGVQLVLARKLQSGAVVSPEDVALIMMQVKIARLAHNPDHKDSTIDIAGYSQCFDNLQSERAAGRNVGAINGLKDGRWI